MEYSELPYLVQEYNPTYLNNQTTYQAGRDTKNAKEVQDKQYNQANDLYDSADNLRDQADQIEDFLAGAGHGECLRKPDVSVRHGGAECVKNPAVCRCFLPRQRDGPSGLYQQPGCGCRAGAVGVCCL